MQHSLPKVLSARSKRLVILGVLGSVLLLLAPGCYEQTNLSELSDLLTTEQWSKETGTNLTRERFVFTFSSNGTYRVCVFNHFGTRATTGTWRLESDSGGPIRLLLENKEAYYHCLWRDCTIRHDKERDLLLISPPAYVGGEQQLQRVRAKRGGRNCPGPAQHVRHVRRGGH